MLTGSSALSQIPLCTRVHIHTHKHTTHMCTCIHHTHAYTCTYTTHTCTHPSTLHTCVYTTHIQMCTCAHTHTFSHKYKNPHQTLDSKGLNKATQHKFQICEDPPTLEKLKLVDLRCQRTAPKNQTELF